MLRTFALLAALLSTTALAQELSPPPLPPLQPAAPEQQPRPRAPALRPLTSRDPDRFQVPRTGAIPEGFHLVEEPKWGLVAAGSGAFVGSTAIMVLVALATRNAAMGVPVVGQFVAFGDLMRTSSSYGVFFGGLGLLVDLAAQVAGVAMFVAGFANPTRWLERDATAPRVMFVPGAAGTPMGASFVGSF